MGRTNDFDRRLREHLTGKSPYTSKLSRITPMYLETCKSEIESVRRELALKKLNPVQKMKLVKSSTNVITAFRDNDGSK